MKESLNCNMDRSYEARTLESECRVRVEHTRVGHRHLQHTCEHVSDTPKLCQIF